MMKKDNIFVPGEVITVEEEYSAGKNTFEENGIIKSSGCGKAVFDNNNKEVSLNCKNVSNLIEGDLVFGKVLLVKEAVAVIEIIKTEKNKILTINRGQIPAKFASNNYVSNMKNLFKIGDLVKARVISSNDLAVDLSTQGKDFGVITAYCSNCRNELKNSNNKLVCFNCGNIEERKWFESKDDRIERNFDSRRPRNNFKKTFDRKNSFDNRRNFNNKNFRGGQR